MKTQFFVLLFLVLALSTYSQTKLRPCLGLHATMDAAGEYVGPSFMAGADYQLKNKFSLSSYFHYFHDRLDIVWDDGTVVKGEYQSYIVALMLQRHLSKSLNRGVQLALGAAFDRKKDDYIIGNDPGVEQYTIVTAALRVGYKFPVKQHAINVELNAVGPYFSDIGPPPYYAQTTEILTQLSLGVRFIF